jgi:predicted nucleotidyltransferase
MNFNPDFKEFVKLLTENKVEYLIVGGYAVGVHGYPRYTGDLDVWINNSDENANRILKCVNDFGFSSYNLKLTDFTSEGSIIQLGYPPIRIDIINQIDGVKFSECFTAKKIVTIDNLQVNFIGYDDLIKNKKATSRPRDIDDIQNLSY